MTIVWKLACSECNRTWAPDQEMREVQKHFIWEHGTDEVTLNLKVFCYQDDVELEYSESGDSGQCPTCGRFVFLRMPKLGGD